MEIMFFKTKSTCKKICLLFLVFFCSIAVFPFGGPAPQCAVGHIKYYGNVPFEFAGFETVDGYVYTIQVEENSSFTLKDIEAAQGNMLELIGRIEKSHKNAPNVLKDGIFVVSEWKKL